MRPAPGTQLDVVMVIAEPKGLERLLSSPNNVEAS